MEITNIVENYNFFFFSFKILEINCILIPVFMLKSNNPVHMVFYLIVLLCNVALLLILLQLVYIGLLILVVYTGAMAIIFLFVLRIIEVYNEPKHSWKGFLLTNKNFKITDQFYYYFNLPKDLFKNNKYSEDIFFPIISIFVFCFLILFSYKNIINFDNIQFFWPGSNILNSYVYIE